MFRGQDDLCLVATRYSASTGGLTLLLLLPQYLRPLKLPAHWRHTIDRAVSLQTLDGEGLSRKASVLTDQSTLYDPQVCTLLLVVDWVAK